MKTIYIIVLCLLSSCSVLTGQQFNYQIQHLPQSGNPNGLNQELDDELMGWNSILDDNAQANSWSMPQPLPFAFTIYGQQVGLFQVSHNGLLTFEGTMNTLSQQDIVIPPSGDNHNLPSALLPDLTVACFWDNFTTMPPTDPGSKVYTKVFGQAPNRQLWIKWNSFEYGDPAVAGNTFACVLEESSNKIYMIDMGMTTPPNVSTTVGIQQNNNQAIQFNQSNIAFDLGDNVPSTNTQYTVELIPLPPPIHTQGTPFNFNDINTGNSKYYWIQQAVGKTWCTDRKINKMMVKITVDVGEDYEFGETDFSLDFPVTMIGFDDWMQEGVGIPTFNETITFHLEETQPEQVYFYELDISEYLLDPSKNFSPRTKQVQITPGTLTATGSIAARNALRMQVEIIEDYDFNEDAVVVNNELVNTSSYPITLDWISNCTDINNYEIQIMRVYNKHSDYPADPSKFTADLDWSKALSIVTESPETAYSLQLAEGTGYYVWRVRPIGGMYSAGVADPRNWGDWSHNLEGDGKTASTITASPDYAGFYYTQFDDDKNWIYNRTFSEENKLKESIRYANGLGQAKQTQVKLYEEANTSIVHQNLYDYSGRQAMVSLPAPVGQNSFSYVDQLLTNGGQLYTATDFDEDSNFDAPSVIDGGAVNQYYSDLNPNINIASAEGYPFTRTLFYSDGDNRVYKQSGIGKELRLRSTSADEKVSRVYYASVPEMDLIKLFGEEAPQNSTVYQVITQDPNNTTSFEYINKAGQVIVKGQASSGAASSLTALDSRSGAMETITYNNDVNASMSQGEGVIASKKIAILTDATPVDLHFEITPAEITASCGGFCTTCDYDATFIVQSSIDPDDKHSFSKHIAAGTCSSTSTFSHDTTLTLSAGTHKVYKEIRINNINPLTGKSYLEEHKKTISDDLNSLADTDLAPLYEYLDTAGMEAFYAYLGIDLDAVEYDNDLTHSLSIANSCIHLEIPVLKCGAAQAPAASSNFDFEQMLYDRYSERAPKPANFFFTDGHERYPTRKTHLTLQLPSTGVFTLQYERSSFVSTIARIDIQPYHTLEDFARKICRDINNDRYWAGRFLYATYELVNADVIFHFYEQNAFFGNHIIHPSPPAGISPFIGFNSYYSAGKGPVNALLNELVAENYASFEEVYAAWFNLVLQYESRGFKEDHEGNKHPNKNYDIVGELLELLGGPQYTGYTTLHKDAGNLEGFNDHPHRLFKYQPCQACEDSLGFDPNNIWPPSDTGKWNQLAKCANSRSNPRSKATSNYPSVCNDPKDPACITAMRDQIEVSCEQNCWLRYESFYNSIEQAYKDAGTYSPVLANCIRMEAIHMVYQCQQDCGLSIVYDGLGNPTSVGTPSQIELYQHVFGSTYEIQLTSGSACNPDYKYIPSIMSSSGFNPVQMTVDRLNSELKRLKTNSEWVSITDRLSFTKDQLIAFCEKFIGYANPIDLGVALPPLINLEDKDITSYFYYDPSAGELNLIEHNTNTSVVVTHTVCTGFDFTYSTGDCGQEFCFKWMPIVLEDTIATMEASPCILKNAFLVKKSIQKQVQDQIAAILNDFERQYQDKCDNTDEINDIHTIKHQRGVYHFTLFYYDRNGNLVKTIPPKGIDLSFYNEVTASNMDEKRCSIPEHSYETKYAYNSLGQLIRKETPDGGVSELYYDGIGRIRFSQNEQQKNEGEYSYIKYDDLGRTIESGVGQGNKSTFLPNINDLNYPNLTTETEVKSSQYSEIATSGIEYDYDGDGNKEPQSFTENRLSKVYSDAGDATWFSYDAHGNITWMIQEYPDLGKKTMAYYYDLVSGNIKEIHYNYGHSDQFFHRIIYDSDNRVTEVQTSKDSIVWDTDARYSYYLDGSVKRVELGEDRVQGLDYVYTIQGWLKGINHSSSYDPGGDGQGSSKVAKDAFGMTLNYFEDDFNRSYGGSNSVYNDQIASTNLYNGLITSWETKDHLPTGVSSTPTLTGPYQGITARNFSYDELGRLLSSTFSHFNAGSWASTTDYATSYSYDANGNITNLTRNAFGINKSMDDLSYHYSTIKNDNKLLRISDAVSPSSFDDLDDQGSSQNYHYNAIGELTKDVAEGIDSIYWTATGKVKQVIKTTGETINYVYDAKDQRLQKIFDNGTTVTTTYYVRDVAGQTIATYKKVDSNPITHTESAIQGGERLGLYQYNSATIITAKPWAKGRLASRMVNKRHYELKDHLGNVRHTITDVKLPNGSTFEPKISSIHHYYPYGMQMPGMSYTSGDYRFGFQGMEKDEELKADGNSYTTFFRAYDPRVGRWLSLDPKAEKFPSWSPYKAFKNNPIYYTDPFGDEEPQDETTNSEGEQYEADGIQFTMSEDGSVVVPAGLTLSSASEAVSGTQIGVWRRLDENGELTKIEDRDMIEEGETIVYLRQRRKYLGKIRGENAEQISIAQDAYVNVLEQVDDLTLGAVAVYEAPVLSGVYIPDVGIIVPYGKGKDKETITHEFGHYLQYQALLNYYTNKGVTQPWIHAQSDFYRLVGFPSAHNNFENILEVYLFGALKYSVDHKYYYVETDANARSQQIILSPMNHIHNRPTVPRHSPHSTYDRYMIYINKAINNIRTNTGF